MAEVDDYTNGKILASTKLALRYLKFIKIPVIGSLIRKKLQNKISTFDPRLLDVNRASKLIHQSMECAVGERVCRAIYTNSEITEAVFLDELAQGMTGAGKARFVTKEGAINTLKKYPDNPLILSKVSGKYMEICCSSPGNCVYWNMERWGLKCLNQLDSL
ncbi:MAG: hypothetical protein K8R25_12150 [Methanosarcinales archaeon]|nr:hypothetical protein [Methanosarcinales archaeon]